MNFSEELEQELKEKKVWSLLRIKTGNDWLNEAMCTIPPKPLYKNLWFESELCILFAETNAGKTILAVKIAHEISLTQKVIYFDFELSAKQFEARYSENYSNHFRFSENFLRAEIDPDSSDYKSAGFNSFEDYLDFSIEESVKETAAKVLIVDNITYLRSETEKARDALPLMKRLKEIKSKYGLSILCLAHCPKRNNTLPITKNDLQGSKMLINFCDSSFAIGESRVSKEFRYIKQIKARNTEIVYDSENVLLYRIAKKSNFLTFEDVQDVHDVHLFTEHEHLAPKEKKQPNELIEESKRMHKAGKKQRDIAYQLGISVGLVNKYLRE